MITNNKAPISHLKDASTSKEYGNIIGKFRNVRQAFKLDKRELLAISDISFDLYEGHLVSLLGPSGCGKTSFLKIVAGLYKASSGIIEVRGRAVQEPQSDFSFVFQQPNLLPWRSVLKNVLLPLEISGSDQAAGLAYAKELLSLTGLSEFENYYPGQLSGGMMQRVALCRALVSKPALLLMDEPFGALDELTRMEMHDLLLKIRKTTGTTVLFVTHSVSEAVYLSDKIVVFSKRPAVVQNFIDVDLPYPRTPEVRYESKFVELEHTASRSLGVTR